MPADSSKLCVHEIANGQHREKALDKAYATLVLCWHCNGDVVTDKKTWPQARQLARILTIDPANYDLAAFNLLVSTKATNRITQPEVLAYCTVDAADVASLPALRLPETKSQ